MHSQQSYEGLWNCLIVSLFSRHGSFLTSPPITKWKNITMTTTKSPSFHTSTNSTCKPVSRERVVKHAGFSQYSTLIITRRKTSQQFQSLWHTKQELKQFKENTGASVRQVLHSAALDAKTYIETSLTADPTPSFGGQYHLCGLEHLLSRALKKHYVLQDQNASRMCLRSSADREN